MKIHINNKPLEVAPEPADYWKWIAEGRYNHEWAVYDKFLRPDHTFVDVGAWVGAHSLYASTITKHPVVAVEPDPVAFAILQANVKDAHLWNRAITDKRGTVKMGSGWLGASTTRINPNAGGGIGPWVDGQTFDVECFTLRDLVKNLPDPLFIKIDVEGSEELIIKNEGLFAMRQPTVLIELHPFWWHDAPQTWQDFEVLKEWYKNTVEVPHKNSNTWVLHP